MNRFRVMMEPGLLSSADGLAGDEALAVLVAQRVSPPTLRLYHYVPCAIVGRYQNLTDAIDVEECRASGLEWNRRHTGGGTVLMGPQQLAIALVLPDEKGKFAGSIRRHFEFFAGVLSDALFSFGLKSSFVGKNDLQVDGKKIAGLAISEDVDGAVFYHGSLLLDFDTALMVRVLNLPTMNLDDRGQSCFSRRMATVREFVPDVTSKLIMDSILRCLSRSLQAEPAYESWTSEERSMITALKAEKYENDGWIYSTRVMRRWRGVSERKTDGGTLRIYADKSGPALDAVLITGDYFTRSCDLARLEASLKGTPARLGAVLSVIQDCGECAIYRVPPEELAELIVSAVGN